MIEVKICGITNPADARTAVNCGANALGFIFYSKSPRYIHPEKARWIMDKIRDPIIRVGVFVNQPAEEIKDVAGFCRLHLIQLHGNETPEFCNQFPASRLIKAITPRQENDLLIVKAYRIRGLLIDSRYPGIFGGTGERADWSLARKAGETRPLILAGGLGVANVAEAIRSVSPRALDLNSGLESSPGKKDPEKIKRVMKIIRGIDPKKTPPGATLIFGSDLVRK
jgi:phosphoribosylanthranilate isomerase